MEKIEVVPIKVEDKIHHIYCDKCGELIAKETEDPTGGGIIAINNV